MSSRCLAAKVAHEQQVASRRANRPLERQQEEQQVCLAKMAPSRRVRGGLMWAASPANVARLLVALASIWLLLLASSPAEAYFGKRTQYHEQGLHGPKSYKFGFTAGDHKNPQQRHEVSDGYGHVKGWYSFVDAHGHHQVVHYEAHPKYGFKVLNHKAKAYNTGKRHYNSR